MKRSLSMASNKIQPFLLLRCYLILSPLIFFIYFYLDASLNEVSLAVHLSSQAINPVILLIALLSVFWLATLSIAQNQMNKKVWNWTVSIFIISNILTGNILAIILGIMTKKQNIFLKDNKEISIPNLSIFLITMISFLMFLSLLVCFAFIRITFA